MYRKCATLHVLMVSLVMIAVTAISASASSVTYSTFLGGNQYDNVGELGIDAQGNTYVIIQSPDFPVSSGAFSTIGDFVLAKFSPSGTRLWATRLGFTGYVSALFVDASGNSYIAGSTTDTRVPTSAGAFQRTPNGSDGFVVKFNSSGQFVAGTYLGGPETSASFSGDGIGGIALDPNGNVYVTGSTDSRNFPVTPGAYDTTYNGTFTCGDRVIYDCPIGFFSKIKADFTTLVYSSYLGGDTTAPVDIAVNSAGEAYLTGYPGTSYPTTMPNYTGSGMFVTKINASGSGLVFSFRFGGANPTRDYAPYELVAGIQLDAANNVYVAGSTEAQKFPTTANAFQHRENAPQTDYVDAYVIKFAADGKSMVYSTVVGGKGVEASGEYGNDLYVDPQGFAYVTGNTFSSDFPLKNPVRSALGNPPQYCGPGTFLCSDAFAFKLNQDGSQLLFSTYWGGVNEDVGHAIGADANGNVIIGGNTVSYDYPTTGGAYDRTWNDGTQSTFGSDGFLAKFNVSGTSSTCAAPSTAGVRICTPTDGATVSSPVQFAASAYSGSSSPIKAMKIYVDGVAKYEISSNQLNASLVLAPGTHRITIKAWDWADNVFARTINITVASTGACAAPSTAGVRICAPSADATVSSPVTITAAAKGNAEIVAMKIYRDGTSVYQTANSSFSTQLAMSAGPHRITVKAWDSNGQSYATTININVAASACAAPSSPGLNLCSPANGATVASPVPVSAAAKAAMKIDAMKVYIDGTSVYATPESTLSRSFSLSSGSHRITVKAWDTSGAVYVKSVTITVN